MNTFSRFTVLATFALVFLGPLCVQADQMSDLQARIEELKRVVSNLQLQTFETNVAKSDGAYAIKNACTITKTLSLNMRDQFDGGEVAKLQSFLSKKKYLAVDKISGVFGTSTQQALGAWQSDNGLASARSASSTGYGILGPRSRALLATQCIEMVNAAPMPTPVSETAKPITTTKGIAVVNVTSPLKDNVYPLGSTMHITWQGTNISGNRILIWLVKDGKYSGPLNNGTLIDDPNYISSMDGEHSYDWNVGSIPGASSVVSGTYTIAVDVADFHGILVRAASQAFSITSMQTDASNGSTTVRVLYPNGGEQIKKSKITSYDTFRFSVAHNQDTDRYEHFLLSEDGKIVYVGNLPLLRGLINPYITSLNQFTGHVTPIDQIKPGKYKVVLRAYGYPSRCDALTFYKYNCEADKKLLSEDQSDDWFTLL